MRQFDFESIIAGLWRISQQAGEAIADCVHTQVKFKPDDSPVTAADMASHAVLVRNLPQLIDAPVLSEETDGHRFDAATPFWLVDPLDGTKEFIAGSDEFVVCIALMEKSAPALGFIYQPRTQTAYWGGQQWGSFKQVAGGTVESIKTRRANFDEPLIACVSRQNAKAEAAWIEQLSRHWPSGVLQRPMGSALKACLLADGGGDIYPRRGRTCIWDTAAAQAILQGAGGDFFTLNGQTLSYKQHAGVYNAEFIAVADKTLPWLELLGIN
ncbi:MAG TPA: 3'(2'),5'-bisphosphate nucleotidase CysQ [Cellvibrionaceae bacterium]